MNEPRRIGMMINHQEVEHILTGMADVIRNAAYKVAGARWPEGHHLRHEYFDETGTLKLYDEMSVKALLKDAIDHYLEFHAINRSGSNADFNYYLGDSFALVASHINADPALISFLTAQFAMACGTLAASLSPAINDLAQVGQGIEKIESFVMNNEESYYLVYGENFDNPETYDPEEDRLDNVDTYQSPEELEALKQRREAKETIAKMMETGAVTLEYRPAEATAYTGDQSVLKDHINHQIATQLQTNVGIMVDTYITPEQAKQGYSWTADVTLPPGFMPYADLDS